MEETPMKIIAQRMAESMNQPTVCRWSDRHTFEIDGSDNSVTPFKITVGHILPLMNEKERMHVEVSGDAISFGRMREIAEEYNLRIVDVWQTTKCREKQWGQHSKPTMKVAFEPYN